MRKLMRMSVLPFSVIARHRDVLWQFVQRSVELRHKGSHLGLLWSVFQPLLMLALYVFVFGYIFKGSFSSSEDETKLDYSLGIFTGLTIFHFISEVLATSPNIVIQNTNLVKKVVFPIEIIPIATAGSSFIHFLISFVLLVIGVALVGSGLSFQALWLLVIIPPVLMLGVGISWAVASIGVFFRDIMPMIGTISLGLMFSSAVFYPSSDIPETFWLFLKFNPLIHAIEMSRSVLIWQEPFDIAKIIYLYAVGISAFYVGFGFFKYTKKAFADVL